MLHLPLSNPLRRDRLVEGDTAAGTLTGASTELTRRIGWGLLGSYPGRQVVRGVCRYMAQHVIAVRGAPTLESPRGIIRLWRVDRFEQVSVRPSEPWRLDDGTMLMPRDPVLDFHIVGALLRQQINMGAPWKQVLEEEFRSMSRRLAQRDETALFGTTILWRQAAAFGASTRAVPPGPFATLDTFYREMILLAFHPGGINRVLWRQNSVAEAAISRLEFCRRYGVEQSERQSSGS
jgi:hypothetical protein